MQTFHVAIPVRLDIEVDADDPITAITLIDQAFGRADCLSTPNVRLHGGLRARVLDQTPLGPAGIVEHDNYGDDSGAGG
jgi:hypothetical protein